MVLGCGSVGLCAIVAARYLGAEAIVAVDGVESRRKRAESLGALVASPDSAGLGHAVGRPVGTRWRGLRS